MYTDPSETLPLLFARMAGIALVRPVVPIENVDVGKYLSRCWHATPRYDIGIVIANASEPGIELTVQGLVGQSPFMASVDMMPIPQWDSIGAASSILLRTRFRIEDLTRQHLPGMPINLIVAIVDEKPTLEELARRVMFELNLDTTVMNQVKDLLDRPGDGLMIDAQGTITDRPIVPRCLKYKPVAALG